MPTEKQETHSTREVDFGGIRLLADLDRISLAELIPSLEQIHVDSGDLLFRTGEPGDALFIIIDGIVRVFVPPGGGALELACLGPGDWFGEMALLTGEPRSTDIEAQTDLTLLRLSRNSFDQLIKKHPSVAVSLAGLLAAKLVSTNAAMRGSGEARQRPPAPPTGTSLLAQPAAAQKRFAKRAERLVRDRRFLSILLALVLCVPSAYLLKETGLSSSRITLMEILLAATIMWSLNAFSFHTISIAIPVATVLLGVTTPDKAFSGFSSSTWFLVLGVFGLSAAISKTGLLYRLTLMMMRRFPRNYFGQAFAVAFSGLVLTPVIPSPNGRVILASPLLLNLTEILGFKKGSPGAVGLSMASFLGYGNMSIMFMNGSFVCFFMLGLLPPEVSSSITFGVWFKAAILMSACFFVLSFLGVVALHRPAETKELVSSVTDAQLRALGPLTTEEKVCLVAVVASLAGFLTQSWHRVDGAWIAMLSLLILFATSVLDDKTVRTKIDWAFLISLGALIGFGNVISASGLPQIVAQEARPYIDFFSGSKVIFLMAVTVGVLLIRFILPAFPSLVVCMLALLPIGTTLEIDPFVIGLIVLLVNEPWFLPHQSLIFQTFLSSTEGRLFEHRQIVKTAILQALIALVAVALSVPYWKYLGLIR